MLTKTSRGREREMFQSIFSNNKELWVYASRDTDGDNIRDYRIDEYHGRFMEGDTDIDDDGIRNTVDINPYDAALGANDAKNNNGVPDHIDWSLQDKSDNMAQIQQELYNKYEIILVERSTEFTEPLVQVIYDIVTRAFRPQFENGATLPALTTVAAIKWTSLDLATDDRSRAQVLAHSGTLEMFQYGIDLDPFLLLGLLGHELSHSIQFSMDYSESDHQDLLRNIYRGENFYKMMAQFDWSFDKHPIEEKEVYSQITPQYQELRPYKIIRFKGKTFEQWKKFLNKKSLDHKDVRKNNIVGKYSLSSPYEWHADYMIAYLFVGMEDYAEKHFCSKEQFKNLKALTKRDNVKAWKFNHQNSRSNTKALEYFHRTYPIDEQDWGYLTREYLLNTYTGVC